MIKLVVCENWAQTLTALLKGFSMPVRELSEGIGVRLQLFSRSGFWQPNPSTKIILNVQKT